jgi:hypothetical protein
MSRGYPSLTALLALLAIAGYQNRDKIAEMLGKRGQDKPGDEPQGAWVDFLVSAVPVPAEFSVVGLANL